MFEQSYMNTHWQGKALPARSYCDLAESEKQHILKGYVAVADDNTSYAMTSTDGRQNPCHVQKMW